MPKNKIVDCFHHKLDGTPITSIYKLSQVHINKNCASDKTK